MTSRTHTLGLLGLVLLTAGSVGLSAQWGQQRPPRPPPVAMSGTYELDATRGDSVQRAADSATRSMPSPQRDRANQSLMRRLQPPTMLAIDRDGRTFTISSSSGPRATFDADGRTRDEQGPNGRLTTTRADFNGNRLSVSTSGNRNTDYLVTFEPLNNGNGLLITRRLDRDDLRQPVTVRSYYRRVRNQPQWDLYQPEPGYGSDRGYGPERGYDPRASQPRTYGVPEGTRIGAVLDTSLSTRTSRSGERFSMTVRSPEQYEGAQIDGVVARVTPYGDDRHADLAIDFETIRMRNGQAVAFDGVLDTVRTPGGATLQIDASGNAPDSNRTNTTIQHGAIGAALGAVIGVIVGGGKGAAIGAVAGGAGGVILAQGRDQHLDLPPGTQVTLIAAPLRDRTP
ncbi:MAG: hypothetical protein ACM3NQ_13310, partial [Bacteroidales bacterium]